MSRRFSLHRVLRRPRDIEAEAARWSDRLCDGDAPAPVRRAFQLWHDADPAHARAFADVNRTYRLARAAGGAHALSAMESEILSRVTAQRRGRRQLLASAAMLLVGLTAAALVTGDGWRHWPDQLRYALAGDRLYRTDIGERLVVSLTDGSQLTLNTDSRVVVRYRDKQRAVALLRGQALFEVARDSQRPFVVSAGQHQVTALGTAFDVRLLRGDLAVTLLNGRVAIDTEGDAAHLPTEPVELRPGEQWRVAARNSAPASASPPGEVLRPDLRRVVSWRSGQVIFEDDRLIDAVDEINRYGRRQVVLADPRLHELRVSGAFGTHNTTVFLDMLMLHFPVRVIEATRERIVLGHAGQGVVFSEPHPSL